MRKFAALVVLGCAVFAQAEQASPVEKVIELLEELKTEVEDSGKAEASTYDEFACFCKDKTEEKSDAIKEEQDNWDGFSATFDEQTGLSKTLAHEIKEQEELIDKLEKQLKKTEEMRNKEVERYEVKAADLSHGVASLEGAIDELEAGKGASLLSTKRTLRKAAALAETLNLSPKHRRTIVALLQDDADDAPEGEFAFHSDDIIETIKDLEDQFKDKKDAVEQEEGENKKDYDHTMETLNQDKDDAEELLATKQEEKEEADGKVAQAQEDMDLEAAALADDQLYLKDLTMKCELKAREFDQQSKMRADEVTALESAIKIVKEKVKDNADDANKRSLVQVTKGADAKDEESLADMAADELQEANEEENLDLSFLQVRNSRLKIRALVQQSANDASAQAKRQERVISALLQQAQKIGSPAITALALKVSADPFVKVKKLIQDLIQRLIQEAADEATKKGWCDTEQGKAKHTRDQNFDKSVELNANLIALEAQKATLEEEISTLTVELAELNDSLTKTTKIRAEEKAENEDTVSKAKAGLAAVKDAYEILQNFYKKASKGKVELAETKVTLAHGKASPIDEDAPDSGMGGAYKGNQQKAGGILAMLDVIISDFERTIRVTTDTEKQALREFTEFDRTTKTSIGSKESQKVNAEAGLKATENQIVEDMSNLEKRQKMLDDSLKELEDLKPACVDTGMSYEDRVQKRKDEIEALKKALCELDPEQVEDECK